MHARNPAGSFPPAIRLIPPLARVGRGTLVAVEYLGAAAILCVSAVRATRRVGMTSRAMRSAVVGELTWMVGMGLPLVGLVSVGMGSFLSMQAYFGGTFADGTGAVVGVGLVRNLGPLMSGLTLAGLFAARVTPALRAARRVELREREGFLERTARGSPAPREAGPVGRTVAATLIAGGVCGLVMSVWASAVGTLVGWQIAGTMVGVSTSSFFMMFFDLLWPRDVVGLLLKGPAFGMVAALIACHEGLWRSGPGDASDADEFLATSAAACRAASLAILAVLVINSGMFILFYNSGLPFGPTLLAPPTS